MPHGNMTGMRRRAVLYNCFAHLDEVARAVAACYAEEVSGLGPEGSLSLAYADVLEWWRRELVAMAGALRRVADKAKRDLGIDVRLYGVEVVVVVVFRRRRKSEEAQAMGSRSSTSFERLPGASPRPAYRRGRCEECL